MTAVVRPLWEDGWGGHWCDEWDRRVGWHPEDCPCCNEVVRVGGDYRCPACGSEARKHPLIPGIAGGFHKLCDKRIVKT